MRQSVIYFVLLAVFCLVELVQNAPQQQSQHFSKAAVIDNQNTFHDNGDYEFKTTREDGTYQEERGTLKDVVGAAIYSVVGTYTYHDENGELRTVNYKADENGYVADV